MTAKKCVICGKVIGANQPLVPYKNRHAHEKCFTKEMVSIHNNKQELIEKKEEERTKKRIQRKKKTLKSTTSSEPAKVESTSRKTSSSKPKIELKGKMTEEEYKKKKAFYTYVRQLTGDKKLDAKIYTLCERYIEQYNFTFEMMHKTLEYLNDIKQKVLTGDVVGIIPYYYTEAENFYKELKSIEEKNKETNPNNLYKEHVIYIKPQRRKPKPTIDITTICSEEGDESNGDN